MYKMIEVVGQSTEGFSEAIRTAVERASKHGIKVAWFEVLEQRGGVKEGKIDYQVILKLGIPADELK